LKEELLKKNEEKKKEIPRDEKYTVRGEKEIKLREAVNFWAGVRNSIPDPDPKPNSTSNSSPDTKQNSTQESSDTKEVTNRFGLFSRMQETDGDNSREDGLSRRNNFKKPTIQLLDWRNARSESVETPNTQNSEPGLYRPGSLSRSSSTQQTPTTESFQITTAPGKIESNEKYLNSTPKYKEKSVTDTKKTDIDMSKFYRIRK